MELAPLPERNPDDWLVAPGDLLFARQSLVVEGAGKCVLVLPAPRPRAFESHIIRVRLDEADAHPPFYYYYFKSSIGRGNVESIVEQVAAAGIRASDLARLTVPLPPVGEQRAIAAVLSALDDKIDSNRRCIGLMEELGASILESTLPADPALDDGALGDYLTVLETGQRPRGGATPEGVVSLGAENVQSAGVGELVKFKRVPEEFATFMKRGHLVDGDVLVYKDGAALTSGASIVSAFGYGFPVDVAVINEHVYRVRGNGQLSQPLLYWLLRSPGVDAEIRKRVTGAAQPGLNSTNFKSVRLPSIGSDASRDLNMRLEPLFKRMLLSGAENRTLAAMRDSLLVGLLSGRIRVPDAVELVEAPA
jgi:type I restriction enzyme S subunit